MTRKEAIADLIAKVEAGEFNAAISAAEGIWGTYHRNANLVYASYRGSLDAAKALHEAVLPGWGYDIDSASGVCVYTEDLVDATIGEADNPARSWLLAIIRALHAQQGD